MNLYKQADRQLGKRNSKKLENHTYLQRRPGPWKDKLVREDFHGHEGIAVMLHETDVVTYLPDGSTILNSGGWHTVTTKERINRYMPKGLTLSSDRGVWGIYAWKNGDWKTHEWVKLANFKDNMRIGPRGGIYGDAGKREEKRQLSLKQDIRKYAQLCADSIPLPLPGAGDCWYCSMRTDGGQTLGDVSKSTGHLISHMSKEESYIVPSLVWQALEEAGWNPQKQFVHSIVFDRSGAEANRCFTGLGKDAVKKAVVKFMNRRFGL